MEPIFNKVQWFFSAPTALAEQSYPPKVIYKATEENGAESSAKDQDDMAIWIHPVNPSQSTVIRSDKHGDIYVYNLDGTVIQTIGPPDNPLREPGNIDVRYNFPLNGNLIDIVGVNQREGDDRILLYAVDKNTRKLTRVDDDIKTGATYGFCFYHNQENNQFYGITTSKSGNIQEYRIFDNGNNKIDGELVREFDKLGQTEGCVVDDETNTVYLAEEDAGVWKIGAMPDALASSAYLIPSMKTNANGLKADLEGIAVYYSPAGKGYIVISNQGADSAAIFDRQDYSFKTTVKVNTSDGDGLDVTSANLGSIFPKGALLAHKGGAEINGVDWGLIATGEGLIEDISWNPKGDGGSGQSRADINQDGRIDVKDFGIFMSNWGASGGVADINKDQNVDKDDFAEIAALWSL